MAIDILQHGITEAQASAVHFLMNTDFNTAGYAAVIDIGGGTTDISFWHQRKLLLEDSVKFAGSDLIEIVTDLVKFVGAESHTYDIVMRKWPYVHFSWDKKMETFLTKPECARTFRTFGLFYGGICYYIGMHMKKEKIKYPLSHVAFAGNGIRFLEIYALNNVLSEQKLGDWIKFFREMLKSGHSVAANQPYETTFVFSKQPKLEVASGLVFEQLDSYTIGNNANRSKKMFGLDCVLDGIHYEYHEWQSKKTAFDFIKGNIDFNILLEFIVQYKKTADKYFNDWQLNTLPEEFNNEMKKYFNSSLERRGNEELASSLFLEALKAYMKIQYGK